ncbi:MAG TPA: hypothetical protein VF062_19025 [Candidatus Limnocylindrales bacterium]
MTVAVEHKRVRHLFERVEQIEEVADTLPRGDERRSTLLRIAEQAIAECAPVRVSIAADLLHLSEPTVRAWTHEGVLRRAPHTGSPRLLLDPGRLHQVMHLVADLRKAGRTSGLLETVWQRLADGALLDREDLTESLEQMRNEEGPRDRSRRAKAVSEAGVHTDLRLIGVAPPPPTKRTKPPCCDGEGSPPMLSDVAENLSTGRRCLGVLAAMSDTRRLVKTAMLRRKPESKVPK